MVRTERWSGSPQSKFCIWEWNKIWLEEERRAVVGKGGGGDERAGGEWHLGPGRRDCQAGQNLG